MKAQLEEMLFETNKDSASILELQAYSDASFDNVVKLTLYLTFLL